MIKVLLYPILVLVLIQVLVFIFSKRKSTYVLSNRTLTMQLRLRICAVVVFLFGSLGSAKFYLSLPPTLVNIDSANGASYEITAETSKHYNYQMEQIAGKANVEAMEFRDWFLSLWQGKQLVYSLMLTSLGCCLGLLLAARLLE